MKNRKISWAVVAIIFVAIFVLSSCADAVPVKECLNDVEPSGFFKGIWHGWISVIAWFVSLFNENVAIYDINNTGAWYDLGFILGIGSAGGSGAKITHKRKSR